MPAFNIAKAVRSNPIYARHTGWNKRWADVLAVVSPSAAPDSGTDFASSVASWQSQAKLREDGMLGPKTWQAMRLKLTRSGRAVPLPDWLKSAEEEGWREAVLSTLRNDTSFIRLRTKTHHITPHDFKKIADYIDDGTIGLVAQAELGSASYEFRNTEDDANSMKVPRRAKFGWRRAQAMIVHEASHAISDMKGTRQNFLDEEATAYVVQLIFLEHFRAPKPTDRARKELYDAAQVLALRFLKGGTDTPKSNDHDWKRLKDVVRHHPVYVERLKKFRRLQFDGVD